MPIRRVTARTGACASLSPCSTQLPDLHKRSIAEGFQSDMPNEPVDRPRRDILQRVVPIPYGFGPICRGELYTHYVLGGLERELVN